MTDGARIGNKAVTSVVKGVAKKTAVLVALGAATFLGIAFFSASGQRWWLLPLSILFGGALGLLNFRWLAIAVERVYLRPGATPGLSNMAAVIINVLKLSVIFIVLFVVIKWQLLHVFGLVGGLSLCFLAILWEGATLMRHNLEGSDK